MSEINWNELTLELIAELKKEKAAEARRERIAEQRSKNAKLDRRVRRWAKKTYGK